LTITADDKTRVFGQSDPPFTASYSGFVNGDTPASLDAPAVLSTPATVMSPVGIYPIEITGAAAANYLITQVNGNLTITPENPVLTWLAPGAITYGTALDSAQLNATANVPGSFLYNPPAGTVLNAGNAQSLAVVFTPADLVNYRSITQAVSINVLKRDLTITAADKAKVYGTPNPPLTAAYSGFVNGDSISSLATPVSLNTSATTGSPEGSYPITAAGATAANYNISFVNGTLTVTRAPLTITADNKSRMVGQTNPPFTATYSGFVNGDTPAVLTTPVSLTTAATASSPIGSYRILASGASAPNYNIAHVDGTLTVTAAPPQAVALSFTNPAAISIPSVGVANPYPSAINVSGLGGGVAQVIVRLNGFRHTWPNDVDVLLVGPTGQKVMLMSDVGGGVPVTSVNLTLSDSATASLPRSTALLSGTFKATDFETGDAFPTPVPAGSYATTLSAFNGSNPNGTWSLYAIDDGTGDSGSFASGWSLTITTTGSASAPPTISDIPNQSTTLNTATAAIPFTLSDPDTALTALVVSGVSSNQTIVPNGNIVFGGSAANRSVTITPATGQSGAVPITISVSDGITTVSDSFVLTITVANNTAPTISSIPAQTINEDTTTGPLSFTVGDAETAAGSLIVSRASSNPALVPTNNIVVGGSLANRTVTVTPTPNQNGVATVTLTVSDGQLSNSTNFTVTVVAVNDVPTISDISDKSIGVGSTTGPLPFIIGDVETPAGSLAVSADSSNPVLVPISNITFGGSGSNRTVTVVPVAAQSGNAAITITVGDGLNTASDTFVLTVSTTVTISRSFTNAASITIPDVGAGTPYPSTINVSGMAGTITQVVARLNGFGHTFPSDVDILLVGPGGQKVMLMSDAGGGIGVTGINLSLSDAASGLLPQATLVSGTYKPTDYQTGDSFPAPAPPGPYGTNLSAFNGLTANGLWSLYAADDGAGDQGSLAAGWSLTITTTSSSTSASPADASAIHHPTLSINHSAVDGSVEITVTAGPGETCQIEASTDLVDWKPIGTVQSDSGISSFVDIAAETRSYLFYRVVTIP
ncbi:MAG TPA: MBG domain-containing protein, partial [Verrucomicrobiae bacterium]|nr:MBG domain-containing protein [Verrucomicrobiae bacterium]